MPLLPSFYTILVGFAPLPVRFLDALQEIQVETSLEQASIFRLQFDLSKTVTGDWDVLEFNIFRPLIPVTIRVNLGIGLGQTLINGYVHDTTLNTRSEPGQSTFEVVGMDATSTLMNQQEKIMLWPNLSDTAIAAAIFGQYGITPLGPQLPPTRTINDTITTQRTTDIRLLKQLAARHGFECYVQPDPIIGKDIGYFGLPRIFLPPQGVLSVHFEVATNLDSFQVQDAMLQPTSALALALDATTKTPQPGIGLAATELPMGREPALQRILPPPVVRPTGRNAANPTETVQVSQSIANRSSRCIRGMGEVNRLKYSQILRPGLPVAVRGVGREYSGHYYVTQVSHVISRDQYTQRFESWRNAIGRTGAEVFVDPFAAIR